MAGAMRKMALYLGLVEDDDRFDNDSYDDHAAHAEDRHAGREEDERAFGRGGRAHTGTALREDHRGPGGGVATVASLREARPEARTAQVSTLDRITTIHPRTYNEAKTIGESFRAGTPVIVNLTEMDDSDAKRLVDFSAGLVFGLHGTIERVTNKVFLLSPANVEVTAEDKARMVQSGFFNQS